jgi:hypothetical protein
VGRYKELVAVHGEPRTWGGQHTDAGGDKLVDRLLTLTMCMAGEKKGVEKSLPPNMKIATLRLLLKKTLKIRARNFEVA